MAVIIGLAVKSPNGGARGSGERKSSSGIDGLSPSRESGGLPQKLKLFADIVYRF